MKHQDSSSKHTRSGVTRREALRRALVAGVAAATMTGGVATVATAAPVPPKQPEFVPENDYPYFGPEPS